MITPYWRRRLFYAPIAGGVDWPYPFSLLAWWFDQVWAWISGLWAWITGSIWGTIENIAHGIVDWGLWLRDRVSEIVGAVWGWLSYWIPWLRDRVGEQLAGVSSWFWVAVNWLWANVWGALVWTRDRVDELWAWMGPQLANLWQLGAQTWSWLSIEVPRWFGWLWGVLEPALIGLGEGLSGRMGIVESNQRDAIADLRDWFSHQIIDPWTDWLRSTADQFIGGIRATWTSVTDWLAGAWRWALEIFQGPILSAAQGVVQRVLPGQGSDVVTLDGDGNLIQFHLRSHATCFTDMAKIAAEAVTQVDARSGLHRGKQSSYLV